MDTVRTIAVIVSFVLMYLTVLHWVRRYDQEAPELIALIYGVVWVPGLFFLGLLIGNSLYSDIASGAVASATEVLEEAGSSQDNVRLFLMSMGMLGVASISYLLTERSLSSRNTSDIFSYHGGGSTSVGASIVAAIGLVASVLGIVGFFLDRL